MEKKSVSTFRLRAFVCENCKSDTEVFGNDTPPALCAVCQTPFLAAIHPLYDTVITTSKTATPYVAPTA